MSAHWTPALGAVLGDDGRCMFRVWSPDHERVDVHLLGEHDRLMPMTPGDKGYFTALVEDVAVGQRYCFRVDSDEHADPASRWQPDGVFGASAVVSRQFDWQANGWSGIPLSEYVIYELHIGTFSEEGTFDGVIPHLDRLAALGITAIELMPVGQFPGERNWGYDGVFPYAAQNTYGGLDGLRRLVDAAHQRGIAVILDVIYNHFGPEGNCASCFGPYTTSKYKTPWGEAINMDGAHSDEVRQFFIENALFWLIDCRIDSLRLDATHFIFDFCARTFLEWLSYEVHLYAEQLDRKLYLIAETDLNAPRLLLAQEHGGIGMDAQWNDDFHHALYAFILDEGASYYRDYGQFSQIVKAIREGFVYSGEYSVARKRRQGWSSADLAGHHFVVFIQNHDQIGNQMPALRLVERMPFDALKLCAALVAFSPYVPMIFMGEEYAETAPFEFFIDSSDAGLREAVYKGRVAEFGMNLPAGTAPPDPNAPETYAASRLNHALRQTGKHRILYAFHERVFALRKALPALAHLDKHAMEVVGFEQDCTLYLRRWSGGSQIAAAFNVSSDTRTVTLPLPAGRWRVVLDSGAERWRSDSSNPTGTDDLPAFESSGEAALTLQPYAVVLLERLD